MTPVSDLREEGKAYLPDLVKRAFKQDAFQAICTLLRVSGISGPFSDPLEEARLAFDDFEWLLEQSKSRDTFASARMALLMYCQAVEMAPAHDLLFNLVQVAHGRHYQVGPYMHLWRPKKKGSFERIPPSAKTKFEYLKKSAETLGEHDLTGLVDGFFSDSVRNAFSHSSYIFGDDFIRLFGGGMPRDLPFAELQKIVNNCFAFYQTLLRLHRETLQDVAGARKYHKGPQAYEVTELLSTKEEGLYGFSVHFSNGNKATFTRRKSGTEAINIQFDRDRGVNFFVGDLDGLERVYKIDGKPVEDWDALDRITSLDFSAV